MDKVSSVVAAYRASRFQESSHPRHPKGSPLGGQFASKSIAQSPLKLGGTDDVKPIIDKLVQYHSSIGLTKEESESQVMDTLGFREALLSAEENIAKEFGPEVAAARHRLLERAFQSEKVNGLETISTEDYPLSQINTLQELYDLAPERAISLLPNNAERISSRRKSKFDSEEKLMKEGDRMIAEIHKSISPEHRRAIEQSRVEVELNPSDGGRNSAAYHSRDQVIRIDENFLLQGRSDFFAVYVHESGHGVDHSFGQGAKFWSSFDPEASLAYNQTASILTSNEEKAKGALGKISKYLRATKQTSAEAMLNDYLGAITLNKIGYGHKDQYYQKDKTNGPSEAWANWFALTAMNDPTITKALEKLTPKLHETYSRRLDRLRG